MGQEVSVYIAELNKMNMGLTDGFPSEQRILEGFTVDEYYSHLESYAALQQEKREAAEAAQEAAERGERLKKRRR